MTFETPLILEEFTREQSALNAATLADSGFTESEAERIANAIFAEGMVCVGCSCTQASACVDLDGEPCRWTPGAPFPICTRCARIAERVAMVMAAEMEAGEDDDAPLPGPGEEHFIHVASEGEMNRAIAVMRGGAL
jgi:hypothetical protein